MAALSRRAFLASGAALFVPPHLTFAAVRRNIQFPSNPFTLGIASGDPVSDGVVLWTRLAPDPLDGGGMPPDPIEVEWEIAAGEHMNDIVRTGRTIAAPDLAHSVHVEVGGLRPDREYWYRFHAGEAVSPIGRTRTLPASASRMDTLRFAFASCQNFEMGYFTPFDHVAREDLAFVIHLGDYIYETQGREGQTRRHVGGEPRTLAEYRTRYAQYKTDPDLQEAHAAHPWFVTWDDHEVDNDYAGRYSSENVPLEVFARRRAAAYQAYYEHMPLRRMSRPHGVTARMHRFFPYGTLASFHVLDTRQYRTRQACGGGEGPLCAGVLDPQMTMLGAAQERWLLDGLNRSRSRWNVIPQQVMMAPVDWQAGTGERISRDQWSGYAAERARLLNFFASRRPANPVVLTGDIHSNFVNDLKLDFSDPKSPTVATELVGTSISSGGDGQDLPTNGRQVLSENPFLKFYNAQRGYVSCDVSPGRMRAEFKVVEYVSRLGAPTKTRASFVIEDGRPGAERD
jgi:alkaline phosphatase D